MLRIVGLHKSFGGLRAVEAMAASVRQGDVLGLVGPNGSGKTTVLDLITGALKPDQGMILFGDRRLDRLPPHAITRLGIARTFQLVRIMPSLTIAENVAIGAMFGADPCSPAEALARALPLLSRVGLAGRADHPAARLTYIDQKRVELARALAARPRLLLLDEWLAGLNPSELVQGIALVRALAEDGITIVMVEHVMDAIRALCTRVLVMNAGRAVAEGTPEQALSDPAVIAAYLGEDGDA
nr:ATP-binding cassette domain-containing protein [Caldovatus aquaticus]